ncbi:MAG: NrdH-redoxin [Clostridia bacterium]|jgi:glutaredoxin-like YruB-family protein|nr:NrdH-redoxin [Clostridia bacterium]
MNIKIYTTSTCHWCKIAKEYFKSKGLEYEEYDVEVDSEKAVEMINKSGQRSVPVIDIDGNIIVGFNKEALDQNINRKEN